MFEFTDFNSFKNSSFVFFLISILLHSTSSPYSFSKTQRKDDNRGEEAYYRLILIGSYPISLCILMVRSPFHATLNTKMGQYKYRPYKTYAYVLIPQLNCKHSIYLFIFSLLLLILQAVNFSHNIRFSLRFTVKCSRCFSRLMICQLSS